MIHEKGLCKVLSAAYKGGGYSVIPVRRQVETVARSWRRNEIILNLSLIHISEPTRH